MRLTARAIAEWAASRDAQAELPRLIRRLILASCDPTEISVPSGDSTSQPGWDGEVYCSEGNAWVPKGDSRWEISCRTQITQKANEDYSKRTKATSAKARKKTVYVSVTARQWTAKKKWREEKGESGEWQDVRAYDADDLEQWLELCPAVALQFAEEIGIEGPGVESLEKFWKGWAEQTDPVMTTTAFLTGRQDDRGRLTKELCKKLRAGGLYSIRADSVGEAVAFACAVLVEEIDLAASAIVVTAEAGWRFVEKNPSLKLAIAAMPEVAERPTRRSGLVVLIPYASGDMAGHFRGAAGREDDVELTLERLDSYEFEQALTAMGVEESDAERLARSTGRSWSVLRRHLAINPAIRRPVWLDRPEAGLFPPFVCSAGGQRIGRVIVRS